ncbi:glycosyltransferase [Streptomyces sp. NPDC020875]|uniref:glycosyltransferase n=1 Tax=Streptomyces sp. NPDC020875 TaxID=3154898 RepID=UPI0033F05DCC
MQRPSADSGRPGPESGRTAPSGRRRRGDGTPGPVVDQPTMGLSVARLRASVNSGGTRTGTAPGGPGGGSPGGSRRAGRSERRAAAPDRRTLITLAAPLAAALLLWAIAVAVVDVSDLSDFGLFRELPIVFWLGLAVLTGGFWYVVRDPRRSQWWPLAYTVGLLVFERATQAVVYPTPLYAWAWKHDAIIEHLLDAGRLQRGAELREMAVYDQWPGFFTAQAALVDLTGAENALAFMSWWPLLSSLMLLLPLLLVYRTFTQDRRLIWTAVWIFYAANWVGQDYFSPQSLAFALYLGVIAVALRRAEAPAPGRRARQMVWTALLIPLIAAIVVAHQLTPVMLVVSLAALCVMGRYRDWTLVIVLVLVFAAWNLTASLPFLREAVPDMIKSFGDVGSNLERGYGSVPTGSGALFASWSARLLSAAVVLLAAVGVFRGGKPLRTRARPLLLLAAVPPLLAVANGYGSEMIFRVLMFMLPYLAFFAAVALLPVTKEARASAERPRLETGIRYGLVPAVVLVVLTALYVPSYMGKDRLSYFPPAEVKLVKDLLRTAPKGSLVVAAHRNYPAAYDRYWDVDHYWFLDDAKFHVDDIVKAPAKTLASDMSGVRPPGEAYFLYTRAQVANSEMNGLLTAEQMAAIEKDVAASPLFEKVAGNDAGVVYRLKRASGRAS